MGINDYKLPVFRTLWDAACEPFRHRREALRAGSLVLISVVCAFSANTYFTAAGLTGVWSNIPTWLAWIALVAFAVAWHRYLILGEEPASGFRFGRRELFYGLFGLVGTGLLLVPVFMELVLPENAYTMLVEVFLFLFFLLVVIATAPVVSLMLPAIAVGQWHPSVTFYFSLIGRNFFRFVSVLLLSVLVYFVGFKIVLELASFLTGALITPLFPMEVFNPSSPDPFLIFLAYIPYSILVGCACTYLLFLTVGAMSLSFRHMAVVRDE